MSARGPLVSGLVTMVIALAGFVTVGALPAAATPGTIQYVALGDSYAAGTAVPPTARKALTAIRRCLTLKVASI